MKTLLKIITLTAHFLLTIYTVNTPVDTLGIHFDYKAAEFVVNLDVDKLYGNITDLLMEFDSPSYFKKGKLDLKSGNISNITNVNISELNRNNFTAIPDTRILQAKFYTVEPASLTNFNIKIKKILVNQDDNSFREIHKTSDPIRNINFTFSPDINKSHIANMTFRYKIPTKTILHVTGITSDVDFAYAAQPSTIDYTGPWDPTQHRQAFNLIKSPNNFGELNESTVYTGGFNHVRCLDDGSLNTKLLAKPDIVIISRYYTLDSDDITALINYLNNKGVVIMMSDDGDGTYTTQMNSVQAFMNSLFGTTDIEYASDINGIGSLFLLNHESTIEDRITYGPFGDLTNHYWGNDSFRAVHLNNLPIGTGPNQATAYSNPLAANVIPITRSTTFPSMFKHNTKSLFWIGNGSFLASEPGSSYGISLSTENDATVNPFAISETFAPIHKRYGSNITIYGDNDNTDYRGWDYYSTVNNSELFANLMAWALYQSEFFGINPRTP